jgi:hypothetical protein
MAFTSDDLPNRKSGSKAASLSCSPTICHADTAQALREMVVKLQPEFIIVEYPWMAECLAGLETEALLLLDSLDVFHLRAKRLREQGMIPEWSMDYEEECRLLRYFDVIIAIQHEEAGVFKSMVPELEVITVGLTFPIRPAAPEPLHGRVMMIGGPHAGSIHGLRVFLSEIWPRVLRRYPQAELEVVGKIGATVKKRPPSVKLSGYVPSLDEAYDRASVVVSPVWIGSGLKIKTIEALSRGKALVTTPCGIEGLMPPCGPACLVTADKEEFADRIGELLNSPGRRKELEQAALAYARRWLVPEKIYEELDAVLAGRNESGLSARRRRPL